MTSITELANELKDIVAWQRTPEVLEDSDYQKMIVSGIKTLYIDTGRASVFNKSMIVSIEEPEESEEGQDEQTSDVVPGIYFEPDLGIDEEKYVLIVAQIAFFKKVQSDVNNIVGYTTDALSVTNADKPYAHLQDTIGNLENERRIVFYKMTSYSFYVG